MLTDKNNYISQNIFLADDDADDRMLFSDALKQVSNSSKFTPAVDGMHLMKVLDEEVPPEPDVIFLDLNMPRKNGFDCLREIRSSAMLKNIPVVILSTNGEEESIKRALEMGANYYYEKPSSFADLKKTIAEVLSMDFTKTRATN